MKTESVRQQRVGDLIRFQIASLIVQGDIKDPRVHGLITITRVTVTADFRLARVYVSVMGEDTDHQSVIFGLKHAKGFMKAKIAKNLKLRCTPDLEFKLDDSLDRGEKLDQLLKEAKK